VAGAPAAAAAEKDWYRSDRIVVRRLRLEDIGPDYVSWFSDKNVRRFIKYAREAPSLDDLRTYWHAKDADPGVDFLGIFDATSGAHLGNIKFEMGPGPAEAHVGFLIGNRGSRRRGLLRECLSACARRLRERRGEIAIYLTVDPGNSDALAAFARLGFVATAGAPDGGDLRLDYRPA